MRDEKSLLPDLATIHERLGQLAREQRRLRTLFKLALAERDEREGRDAPAAREPAECAVAK